MKHYSLSRLLCIALTPLAAAMATAAENIPSAIGNVPVKDSSLLAPHSEARGNIISKLFPPNPLEQGGRVEQVVVSATVNNEKLRRFTISTSQQQREDNEKHRVIQERKTQPQVHSQSMLFDGLFAMAVDDMHQASVTAIRDASYNNGNSIPCDCFETGEKWNYVWTRDLAYAANLGLAHLDPERVRNSMLFKVSGFRAGVTVPADLPANATQILQDTGSGGSWPVSSDRVTWALAVKDVLQSLQGDARRQFLDQAYAALTGTLEADRVAVFDANMGLYGGEQSYLDWRTQTYAPWIVDNLSYMSESKALSTNVLHYQALQVAADLATEKQVPQQAAKYREWAAQLKQVINERFWLNDVGLYATILTSAQDPSPVYKYDMLGNALAIIYGLASSEQAKKIIATYPHTPVGVPVYYPQQPNVYVYHNRSMWPFVTAYALKAAVQAENYRVADNAIQSLVRGSALHISNMENLEWLTGKSFYDDGPKINSRRQLWSVGAYLGMTIETIFGVNIQDQGLAITPFLTPAVVDLLGAGKSARLDNIDYKGHKISVVLHLPVTKAGTAGVYPVAGVSLNGKAINGTINEAALTAENTISISFGALQSGAQGISFAENVNPLDHTNPKVFSPEAPVVVAADIKSGKFQLSFKDGSGKANNDIHYNIFKNGRRVAAGLSELSWRDSEQANRELRNCFAVEAEYVSTGHKSHHSEPYCLDGRASQYIAVSDKRVKSNRQPHVDAHYGEPVLLEWGGAGDSLQVDKIKIPADGRYAVHIRYNNRQHTIDSGVTNAVKALELLDSQGKLVQRAIVQMPNVQDAKEFYPLKNSTEVNLSLVKGTYTLRVKDYFNMSYLQANNSYKGAGGSAGAVNKASIAGFNISRVE